MDTSLTLKPGDPVIWFKARPPGTKITAVYLGRRKRRFHLAYEDAGGERRECFVAPEVVDIPRAHMKADGALAARLAGSYFGYRV